MRQLLFLFALLVLAGCQSWSARYAVTPPPSGEQRARERLSIEQQRNFDKCFLEALRQKHKGEQGIAFELLDAALRINPHASEALYEQGLLLTELPNRDDSLLRQRGSQQLLLAHQLAPSNKHYRQALANYYIQTQRYARAARLYEQKVQEHPRGEDLEVLINLHQKTQNYTAALSALDRLESIEGRNEQTSLHRYAIYNTMGNTARAYQSIWELCEEHPQELRYRIIMGDLYLQNGFPEAAVSLYGDVLTSDTSNIMAKSSMLNYYYMVDSIEAFHGQMTQLMRDGNVPKQQKYSLLRHYAGEALEQRVDKKRMLDHFLEALTFPQTDGKLGEMAVAFVINSKLPEDNLRPVLQALLRDVPSDERARIQLIKWTIGEKAPETSIQLCREGISYQPKQLLYYIIGALALSELGDEKEARSLLTQGIMMIDAESDSLHCSQLYERWAELEYQRGAKQQAFIAYDHALKFDPDNIDVLNNYAYYLAESAQQLDKALNMSSRTVEIAPKEVVYIDTHAWVLYQLRRYPQARQYIDQCLRLLDEEESQQGNNATYYDHAGDIHARCGNIQQAIGHWKKALHLTDDDKLRQQLQRKIRRKRP